MADYQKILEIWQSFDIKTEDDVDKRLANFYINFAFHSGSIENEEITLEYTNQIFKDGKLTNYTGTIKTIFELQNQKICYELLRSQIIKKEPISLEFIKKIHLVLTSGTYDINRYLKKSENPGEFKKQDYVTGVYGAGADARDVEHKLTKMIDNMNSNDVLMNAAYFHVEFQHIHPFADGNGRVGRALTNYYLIINNYPPLIIFRDDKAKYYECLEEFDRAQDIKPMKEFLATQMVKSFEQIYSLPHII